jgi:hypothetical protein
MSGGLRIISEQNMYNLGASLVKAMGFQNVDDFLTDPSTLPEEAPEPDLEEQANLMEAQVKQEEVKIKAAEVQLKAQKIQQEYQKLAVDSRLKAEEISIEREQRRAVAIGDT